MSKLIVVACGAGINTSTIAEDTIRERVVRRRALQMWKSSAS